MNMIPTTPINKFFGLVCFLFIAGIASSTDENLSVKSYCMTPIEYFIKVTSNISTNLFIVDSAALVNVSCILPIRRINIGRYCNIPKYTISYTSDNFTHLYCAAKLSLLTEERFITDISSNIVLEREGSDATMNEQEKERSILPGMYWINAQYNCTLNRVASIFSYVNESTEKQLQILPRISSEWIFPYWKNPAIKARFNIQIRHNNTERAISHVLVRSTWQTNMLHTVFHTTPVMSTHLVTAVVVPNEFVEAKYTLHKSFEYRNVSGINSTIYARLLIKNIIQMIRNKWKNIPQSHVHYFALPLNSSNYESMVTTGLVLFREADIVYDTEIDSIIRRKDVTCLVARSVIQEIFSNWLATFKQSDSWFIEGFSTYYGVHIVNQISVEPLLQLIIIQTRREFLDYMEAFSKYNSSEFIPSSSTFSKLWQIKVFSLFDMLSTLFTPLFVYIEEVIMEQAVNIYYTTSNDSCGKQSTSHDIRTILEHTEKLRSINSFEALNIKNMVISWTTYLGHPVVKVERATDKQFLTIKVIDCFEILQDESCDRKWWISMTFLILRNNSVIGEAHLPPQNDSIFIEYMQKEDCIIILRTTGYRVNYGRQMWKNIINCLKNTLPRYHGLDTTRAQILDDAFYFLVQNPIYNDYTANSDVDIFFDLANNLLQRKKSYIVWYPMLTALEYMSKVFPFLESANIKDKILKILNMFLEDTTHKQSSSNSLSNQLYHEVIKWTCILDTVKCKEHVNVILKWHLNNPTKNKLLPSWQKWIYCQGLMVETVSYEESDLWRTIVNTHQLREIIEFLTCSKNTITILKSLVTLKHHRFLPHLGRIGNEIQSVLSITMLFDMFAKHSNNFTSLNIITTYFDILRVFTGDNSLLAIVNFIMNHIYSDEDLLKFTDNWLFLKLEHMFGTSKAKFMYAAIIKKVANRMSFLYEMRHNIINRPGYVLNYKSMAK